MLKQVAKSLFALIYPRLCAACDRPLETFEHEICLGCLAELPQANLQKLQKNQFAERLNETFPCHTASAHLYLNEGGSVTRELLHALKFYAARELAVTLGHQYGAKLSASEVYAGVEVVVPVPLHHRRQAERGYNQAECFARGIAAELGVPVVADAVSRIRRTRQQSRTKNAAERYKNVLGAFELTAPDRLEPYENILLVDDVVTTGATISECAKAILALHPSAKIYIGAVATKDRG